MKNFQKIPSGRRILFYETMNVTWRNDLGKVVFSGVSGIQILKVSDMWHLDTVFESLTNKIKIFILRYRAISKRQKERNI